MVRMLRQLLAAFAELPLVVKLHTPTFVINEINELYRSWPSKARFIFGGLRRGEIPQLFWKYQSHSDAERVHTALATEITAPSNAILIYRGKSGVSPRSAFPRSPIFSSHRNLCWRCPQIRRMIA